VLQELESEKTGMKYTIKLEWQTQRFFENFVKKLRQTEMNVRQKQI
jgi:hypothetical protein